MKSRYSIFSGTVLMLSVTSCYVHKDLTSQSEFAEYAAYESVWISVVTTITGDTVRFHDKNPGIIAGSEVTGLLPKWIPAKQTDSLVFNPKSGEVNTFWLNGSHYKVIEKDKTNLMYFERDSLRIPLKDVNSMRVSKFDRQNTIFAMAAGITAGVVGIVVYAVVSYANMAF